MTGNGDRSRRPHGDPDRSNGDGNPTDRSGASSEEMSLLTEADAERIVRGQGPRNDEPVLAELGAIVAELRTTYGRPPAEEVRDRHLTAIVAEAILVDEGSAVAAGRKHAQAPTWITPARRGRAIAFRLAATALAALIGIAGLAVAGVKPPAALDSALERIGIGSGSDDRGEMPAAEEAAPRDRDPGDRPGRGEAGHGSNADPQSRSRGGERRSDTGTVNSAPGRDTADEAKSGRTPPTSPGRSEEHRPEGAGPPASPGSQSQGQSGQAPPSTQGSQDRGQDHGQGGSPTGQERSGFGRDRADEASGGAGPPG